eukprot:1295735-Amphidinium_carterae.4
MKDIQVQPWWQYEDDITKYNEKAIEDATNKELSQLVSKQSFKEVDSRTLTQQLQEVATTRGLITERPSNNGTKEVKCRVFGKGFSQFINDTATPGSMGMRLLLTVAILENFSVYTTDVASAFLNAPIELEVLMQPPKEHYHNKPHTLVNDKGTLGLCMSPTQWQERLNTILQLKFTRLKSDACVFINTR